jgi:hypothetical protein
MKNIRRSEEKYTDCMGYLNKELTVMKILPNGTLSKQFTLCREQRAVIILVKCIIIRRNHYGTD